MHWYLLVAFLALTTCTSAIKHSSGEVGRNSDISVEYGETKSHELQQMEIKVGGPTNTLLSGLLSLRNFLAPILKYFPLFEKTLKISMHVYRNWDEYARFAENVKEKLLAGDKKVVIISPAIVNEGIAALKEVASEAARLFIGEEILDWILAPILKYFPLFEKPLKIFMHVYRNSDEYARLAETLKKSS